MAKQRLDYLAQKYPEIEWTGKTYQTLMSDIIAYNHERVAKKSLKLTQESFQNVLGKVKNVKRFVLPSLPDVLPKQSVFLRKGAQSGKLLTDTLRDKLTGNLRDALQEFGATGEPSMVMRRGEFAGQISTKLIKRFKSEIKKTFEGYTKTDPRFGTPSNINAIAITEMRSAINDVKHQYIKQMINHNPDFEVKKRWVHNSTLVKVGREGHIFLGNQKPIPATAFFKIPLYQKVGGRLVRTNKFVSAQHPHDPNLPPDQVISCNCDSEYIIERKNAG